MIDSFQITGRTDQKGKPGFSGVERWNEFFSRYPNKAFICEITIVDSYTEDHFIWYYVKNMLPKIRERFINLGDPKTNQEIDELLRSQTKVLASSRGFKVIFDFENWKPVHTCSREELINFIENVNKYCAENLNLIITKQF